MASVNKVILIGCVGKDPEVRYSQKGMAVANFSVATNKKKGNEQVTQWHQVVAFNKLGEIVSNYVKKGSRVYIEGSIDYSEYTTKDGIKKTATKIIADSMQFWDDKPKSSAPKQSYQKQKSGSDTPFDDDIPF